MVAKRTALTAIQWKNKMTSPMTLPGKPGCYCPIKSWTSKEIIIVDWQIYHIDQHTSLILCEHTNDGIACHYMTDREADMTILISFMNCPLKEKLSTNSYVTENAWLDLTSSWSIKDLERSYKTFRESCCGSMYKLIVWVIMDTDPEDPRTKTNNFKVPMYVSQD